MKLVCCCWRVPVDAEQRGLASLLHILLWLGLPGTCPISIYCCAVVVAGLRRDSK